VVEFSRVPAPQIVVESVAPATSADLPREEEAVVVHQKKIRIRGTITAQSDLTQVRLDGKELPEFAALKKPTRKFTFDLERTLSADKQTFTFRARAQDSKPRSFTLKVEYIPLLPIATLVSPQNLHSRPPSGRDVRLQWELNPLEDHDYKIEVRVNGLEVKNTLDRPTQRLMSDCALTPGKNRIR